MSETLEEPRTVDFSRTMRVECCVGRVHDEGQCIDLYGWSYKSMDVGDYLILAQHGATTRYQLTEFRRPGDPRDMWFGKAKFAPRPSPTPEGRP